MCIELYWRKITSVIVWLNNKHDVSNKYFDFKRIIRFETRIFKVSNKLKMGNNGRCIQF